MEYYIFIVAIMEQPNILMQIGYELDLCWSITKRRVTEKRETPDGNKKWRELQKEY